MPNYNGLKQLDLALPDLVLSRNLAEVGDQLLLGSMGNLVENNLMLIVSIMIK